MLDASWWIAGTIQWPVKQSDLQPAANHAIDRIVATSAHANDLDAGVTACIQEEI